MGDYASATNPPRQRRSEIGHTADLPEDLKKELQVLEKQFSTGRETLKRITTHFIQELEDGLRADGENIPMNLTWVTTLPHGREQGTFITLDLGGTNLRVCKVDLSEQKGEFSIGQHTYELPRDFKTTTADVLWDYVSECLEKFVAENEWPGYGQDNPIPFGFTFSYPAQQDAIDHGVLQTWTKGFDIRGVEGHEVGAQLKAAMAKRNIPVRLVAIINDTVGALVASAYKDKKTIIGAIFGTGSNAAYMEDCGSIPKLKGLPKDNQMAINCEYGAFDNSHRAISRTKYDEKVDEESPRPGEQTFEKCSAGLYLGEIFRHVLLELHSKGLVLKDEDVSAIQDPYSIDTKVIAAMEADDSENLKDSRDEWRKEFGINLNDTDLKTLLRVAEIISLRGARLSACGIAAICKKKGIKEGHVAADGSVAIRNTLFRNRWAVALGEILDWPEDRKEDPIIMTPAEDGSGVGAAVVTAMTLER